MFDARRCDDHVPRCLRDLPQWVLWKLAERGGKPTKVPMSATNGWAASSTDPSTWSTYQQASARAMGSKTYQGVGFVFTEGDPFCGIDLDDCIVDGRLTPQAKAIVDDFGTYTEVSPSGKGVKLFMRGRKPSHAGCATTKIEGMARIEVYDSGRFFTVTGMRLDATPGEIVDCQRQLDELCERLWPKPQPKAEPTSAPIIEHVAAAPDADLDMASRERRCLAYIEKCPDAISGNGGHNATLRAACECYRFGLDEPTAWRVMQIFNDRKTGGERWSDKELSHKLDAARKKVDQAGEFAVRLVDFSAEACEMNVQQVAALMTDVGNAARLVQRFGNRIRYCFGPEQWLIWDGRRWKIDDRGLIVRLCKKTALAILDEAKKVEGDAQDELIKWAMASQKRDRLTAMAALAQPDVAVGPDDLDADPWALNVLNGTVDLRSGELNPHRQDDLITKIAPVEFDPDAACPRFDAFIQRTFDGDADLIRFVQRWHGHCLSGDVREQYLPIYHGEGNNGKSVLLDTVSAVMGDYAGEAPPDLVTVRKHPEHPTEIADLLGKRLVIASETERDAELRLQLIKRLTGNARLKARRMRQDYFEFGRTHKMILVTNNKPTIKEDTEAAWRRLRLVPFNVIIPKEERDPDLMRKLSSEYAGILAWMVRGCVDWLREGLTEPAAITQATETYRGAADVNSLDGFLTECCTLAQGLVCTTSDLIEAYSEWCAKMKRMPLRRRALAAALKAKGCLPQKVSGQWHWVGIDLDRMAAGHIGRIGHDRPIDSLACVHSRVNGTPMSNLADMSSGGYEAFDANDAEDGVSVDGDGG
jgi:putative DNA primase/helicase